MAEDIREGEIKFGTDKKKKAEIKGEIKFETDSQEKIVDMLYFLERLGEIYTDDHVRDWKNDKLEPAIKHIQYVPELGMDVADSTFFSIREGDSDKTTIIYYGMSGRKRLLRKVDKDIEAAAGTFGGTYTKHEYSKEFEKKQKRVEGWTTFDNERAKNEFYIRAGRLYLDNLEKLKLGGSDKVDRNTYIVDTGFNAAAGKGGVNYRFTGDRKAVKHVQKELKHEVKRLGGTYSKPLSEKEFIKQAYKGGSSQYLAKR